MVCTKMKTEEEGGKGGKRGKGEKGERERGEKERRNHAPPFTHSFCSHLRDAMIDGWSSRFGHGKFLESFSIKFIKVTGKRDKE